MGESRGLESFAVPDVVRDRGEQSDYVLTAVDSHPRYLRFVDDWIDSWRLFGRAMGREVNPIVVLVDCNESVVRPDNRRFISSVASSPDLHPALISQVVRLFAPGRIDAGSSVVVTSDIDMFPVGVAFFDQLADRATRNFVVARDVLFERHQFPMCYLAARSAEWKSAFCKGSSLDDDLRAFTGMEYSGERGGIGWNIDQRFAFQILSSWPGLVRLTDDDTGHRRLDRADHLPALVTNLSRGRLSAFADYHAHVDTPMARVLSSVVIRRIRRLHSAL